MTASPKDNLIDWLRDAHSMEEQAEKMLTAQSARLEHYPRLRQRIEQHIRETQEQRQVIESLPEPPGQQTLHPQGPGRQVDGAGPGHRRRPHER